MARVTERGPLKLAADLLPVARPGAVAAAWCQLRGQAVFIRLYHRLRAVGQNQVDVDVGRRSAVDEHAKARGAGRASRNDLDRRPSWRKNSVIWIADDRLRVVVQAVCA